MEPTLKEILEKLRQASNAVQGALIMIDEKCRVTFWSESAEMLFCYTADEITGIELFKIVSPADYHNDFETTLQTLSKPGRKFLPDSIKEFRALRKDGEMLPIELSFSPIKVQDKWNILAIVRDIAEITSPGIRKRGIKV